MKLLLFTDSLSLPRQTPESCEHKNTWPERLRVAGHEVCLSAIGGATIKTLEKQLFYFQNTTYFDAVIVQSGIVDCAPRFVKAWELKLLKSIPLLGKGLLSLLNRNSVRKLRGLTYTKTKTFDQSLSHFETAFKVPTLFIEIMPPNAAYEAQLPGISKNIQIFNSIISKRNHHISMVNFPQDGLMSDHHHLNEKGHAHLAEVVLQKLNTWNTGV